MFTLLLYCRQSCSLWGKSPQTGIAVIAIGDKKINKRKREEIEKWVDLCAG